MVAAMKHMASNFAKLEKFEGVDFRRWKKKMHFFLSSMSLVYMLTALMPKDGGENPIVDQVRKRAKWDNDDYVCRGLILNGMSDSLFDVYQNVGTSKELWDTLEAKYMAKDASSKKFLVSCIIDKLPLSWNDFKHTLKHLKVELTLIELGSHLRIEESLRAQDNDKPKGNNVAGPSVFNMVEHNNSSKYNDNKGKRKNHDTRANPNKKPKDDDVAWWVDSRATIHVCKDRCWFKTFESLNDGSILHIGNESTDFVHRRGCVDLRLNIVSDNIGSAFMSTTKLNDSILWHARLGHVYFKKMQDMSKDGLIPVIDMEIEKCQTCILNKITKKLFQSVKHETDVLELIHNYLCDLHATPSFGNKKYFVTFIDDTSRAVVRLPDPKLKTLGERGIECIFVGYAEHSKAFRFYVIEPNDSVAINSIIESRDAIFDEHRFSSVPRPSQRSLVKGTEDSSGSVVLKKVTNEIVQQFEPELRKGKRHRIPKDFGPEFQLYLIEGSRDEKEAINDEMDSIMGNNTWVLTNLPPGCRPLGCKWIFKRKMKVDGTVKKFKARLVIPGFKQKSKIDYFDTYAPVAHISTIRLMIVMASIHNLIIHQMDVKTAFLNEELEEEAPKQWHQKFNEVVLSNGYLLNQADKCVNLTKEFLSSRFSMKDMEEADIIPVSTPLDTCEKLMPNKGQVVSQLEYFRGIDCLMYAMTCTRSDIAFAVRKLSRYTSNPGTQHWQAIQRASISGSTTESKFMALAATGKEGEWLKNLLLEIPLWVKPIAPIFVRCDSAATLAKAYSHMYNGKSRHLGVRHSMIHELITNGVISIEFVRSQQNLVDHLTRGLARDLVIKSVEGI
ncbi:zinc finger, CCHC-type containing protein [Tanacetum coccineum]